MADFPPPRFFEAYTDEGACVRVRVCVCVYGAAPASRSRPLSHRRQWQRERREKREQRKTSFSLLHFFYFSRNTHEHTHTHTRTRTFSPSTPRASPFHGYTAIATGVFSVYQRKCFESGKRISPSCSSPLCLLRLPQPARCDSVCAAYFRAQRRDTAERAEGRTAAVVALSQPSLSAPLLFSVYHALLFSAALSRAFTAINRQHFLAQESSAAALVAVALALTLSPSFSQRNSCGRRDCAKAAAAAQ